MAYTDEQRTDAVALYVEHGLAEAHRRTGIPKPTISDWARKAQAPPDRSAQKTAVATSARLAALEADRVRLAADLMADTQKLRAQLFAPCVERKAMVVSAGKDMGSEVEVVDIERDQPPFGDQQRIMTTLAIAVDKIQVLTGQATSIVGTVEVPERTPEQEAEMAKVVSLADRRAA